MQKTEWGDNFPNFQFVDCFDNFDMFTIHILRTTKLLWKNGINIFLSRSKQVVAVGVYQFLLFCLTCFSLIYFSDIYINAKYK